MTTKLANVLDEDQLLSEEGSRGRLRVEVPADWLATGTTLTIDVPRRLQCARCDGGGCDACGRSGGMKVEGEERSVTLTLSSDGEHAVRLPRPIEGLSQLIVELRAGTEPSPFCARVPPKQLARPLWLVLLLAFAAVTLVYWLTHRH